MATIIRTDGKEESLDDLSLESLQGAVGGYIEMVRVPYLRQIMWVDEEGAITGKVFNAKATEIAGQLIVGDVVLLTAEETKKMLKDQAFIGG